MPTKPKTVQKSDNAADPEVRRYIYCVIDCRESRDFDCLAIGEGSQVCTVVHRGIGVIVSPSSREKYPIDRQNTLAHQRVMEHVMAEGHTVLPVKFDTIAEAKNGMGPEERIVQQVLVKRYDELSSLIGVMGTRSEMGLKALWPDVNTVFREIVGSDDEIGRLRSKIGRSRGAAQFGLRVKLGELVKNALDAKKGREQKKLLDAVRDLVVDFRKNKTFGDQMFANFAFLLENSRGEEFDRRLNQLSDVAQERVKLRYIGPVAPSNFIELSITWDE